MIRHHCMIERHLRDWNRMSGRFRGRGSPTRAITQSSSSSVRCHWPTSDSSPRPLREVDPVRDGHSLSHLRAEGTLRWNHETELVDYLCCSPELREQLGLERVPNQSTLWRSWHERFTADLRETVETVAQTILITAQNEGVAVPRHPEGRPPQREDDGRESDPNDRTVLEQAEQIIDHVSRIVFPVFSLDRGEGCEIHENAYWGLQTYLGLRENLAANEGARSFIHESTRDRTPLGHAHRDQVRDLSIEKIREMYRQAVTRLLDEVGRTEEFFRAGIVAIDITEADPFTADRTGHEDEIIGSTRSL